MVVENACGLKGHRFGTFPARAVSIAPSKQVQYVLILCSGTPTPGFPRHDPPSPRGSRRKVPFAQLGAVQTHTVRFDSLSTLMTMTSNVLGRAFFL